MKSPAVFVPHSPGCAVCFLYSKCKIPYNPRITITRRPCAPHSHVTAGLLTGARRCSPEDLFTCHQASLPASTNVHCSDMYAFDSAALQMSWPLFHGAMERNLPSACSWERIEASFHLYLYAIQPCARKWGIVLKGLEKLRCGDFSRLFEHIVDDCNDAPQRVSPKRKNFYLISCV